MLASLNSKPLEHLLRAGDFIHLPADCVIHLLHDQTIPPAHARAVAEHLARFWGCPVQIWPVNLDARKLTFFRSFAQSLDAPGLHRLLMGTALPSQRYLGRVFLTREKVGRILSNNAMGDLFGWSTPRLSVLSDHYFMKYSHLDRRPLALIDAIAASSFRVVTDPIFRDLRSDDDIANDWAPIPPEVFSNNGRLVMDRQELGISPRSAAILQRMTLDQIAAAQDRHEDMKAEREIEPKDRPIAEDLSRQLRGIKPETVSPQVPGNPGNGTPQGQ